MSETEFSDWIVELTPSLQGFSRRFTPDEEVASDLVQETIYRALKYREKFRTATNLKGWLFTIMRNTFINLQTRTRRIQRWDDRLADRLTELSSPPDKRLEYQEILCCLQEVPQRLMLPFQLFLDGYLYEEISGQLTIPLGTVKNRIFQCRQILQQKLSQIH